jgi:hypothetical protein
MSPTAAASRPAERYDHSAPPGTVQSSDMLVRGARYGDLANRRLAAKLAAEDLAEDQDGLSPHERLTCYAHRRWVHECIASPLHVIVVTGHRWCRHCDREATVAVDELTGSIRVTCVRCHQVPQGPATRQIVRTCRASLATAKESRSQYEGTDAALAA